MVKNNNLKLLMYILIAVLFIILVSSNYKSKNNIIEGLDNIKVDDVVEEKDITMFSVISSPIFKSFANNLDNDKFENQLNIMLTEFNGSINSLKKSLNINKDNSNFKQNTDNIKKIIDNYRENLKLIGLNIITDNFHLKGDSPLDKIQLEYNYINNYEKINLVLNDLENYLDGKTGSSSSSSGGFSLLGF